EQLRQIPNHGIGYGILQYLGRVRALSELPEPQVSFNYMGQFDKLQEPGLILGPAAEPCGPEVSPRHARPRLLDVTGIVVGGRLRVEFTYSSAFHEQGTMERLAARYVEALTALIKHCIRSARTSSVESIYPLAPSQQGMLFESLAHPASG